MPALSCFLCNKTYSSQSSYNKHLKVVHNVKFKNIVSYDINAFNSKCLECSSSFITISDLREHLAQEHGFEPAVSHHNFDSYEDFQVWLENMCSEENVHYVKENGIKRRSSGRSVVYYNCHRSITSRAHSQVTTADRKRMNKSQGTCKLFATCTSQIKLTQMPDVFEAVYYQTHYNHEKEIQHLHINKQKRLKIANKLALGVSTSRVFDDIIDNVQTEKDCLIKKKDIDNIRTSFGITSSDGRRNKSDVLSIELWVKEQQESENSSVLFYKSQGSPHDILKDEDFCLIFMNQSQKSMLEKFGSNIICIDSTHGLNNYGFQLTSILVVDEYAEGFPVACMFSNREDTCIYKLLFSYVKEKLGYAIHVKTFMSDITNVFINAWIAVMGSPEHQLYCNWHVDQAWQKNLKKIRNPEKRSWVYKTIKYLQYEESEVFLSNLESAVKLFCEDEETVEFGKYFKDYYVTNCQLWALYYRKGCGIGSNMYIESMHKVLKYTHLDGKIVNRLDKGLYAVLKYIKRKIVDRIQKNTKGKITRKSRDIACRHKTASTITLKLEVMPDSTYKVINNLEEYEIKKLSENICCKLLCELCQICLHCFQCNCLDYLVRNTICKHIHYVVMNTSSILNENEPLFIEDEGQYENIMHVECLNEDKDIRSTSDLKDKIKIGVDEVMMEVENISDPDILKRAYEYIKQAKLILTINTSTTQLKNNNMMSLVNDGPANKNIKKQLTFTSTRAKNYKKKANYIQKANKEERQIIKDMLNNSR